MIDKGFEEFEENEEFEEVEGTPAGKEKKGICPVTYEMMKHPWLDENMAKRIVNDNKADDPDFYSFLDEEEEFEEEKPEKKEKKPLGFSITIGME